MEKTSRIEICSKKIKARLREKESFDFIFSPQNSLKLFLGADSKLYIVGKHTEVRLLTSSYQELPEGSYEATPDGRIYLTTRDNIKKIFRVANHKDRLKILNTPEKDLTPPEKLFREDHEAFLKKFE